MTTPRTAAGRAWHATAHRSAGPDPCPVLDMILAIEAEARSAALDEARAAVLSRETIHQYWDHDDTVLLSQPDVLAALDALRERSGE